ncbi:MAG: hypothetical protein ACYDA8_07155 [Deferrisomatales bacterium]
MNRWLGKICCAALVPLGALAPLAAHGATVFGSASTVLEWFDDPEGDRSLPVYQYLQVNARDLGVKGLSFRSYGRLGDDLANETDADSRLYYAYLEKRDLVANLDARLGRQFISTTAGASVMDGLALTYRNLGPFSVEVFGGGDVTEYESYSTQDLVWGTELSGRFAESLGLALSYFQKWDDGELAQELIGFDVEYDFRNILDLYAETQFNYLSNAVSYFLGGFRYHRNPAWSLRADYLYSLPVFDSTSIYSVFAVAEYQQVQGELAYVLAPGYRAFAQYTREIYDEFSDANVYEAGVEKLRTGGFSGYLTGTFRDDQDGQDLRGFKVRGAYLFAGKFELGAGLHLDVLERDLEGDDDTTSKRYWADLTAYLTKQINVQAKLERVESDLWDHYNRGRLRLNILF